MLEIHQLFYCLLLLLNIVN